MTGIEIIAAERRRQIDVEGFTPEHDDRDVMGQLACAAAAYALPDKTNAKIVKVEKGFWFEAWIARKILFPETWDASWWKPSPNDRIRELAKAGALIAAEIDRLQRCQVAFKHMETDRQVEDEDWHPVDGEIE